MQHLDGTGWILRSWGAPEYVCRAGECHNLYATFFFKTAVLDVERRGELSNYIGSRAEQLVFLFSIVDRRHLWNQVTELKSLQGAMARKQVDGTPIWLEKRAVDKLLLIEAANLAEQTSDYDGGPMPWMGRLTDWGALACGSGRIPLDLSRSSVSTLADAKAIDLYNASLLAPFEIARGKLSEAVALNPWAGEPHILLAICCNEMRDLAAAKLNAAIGYRLLSKWSVAWDKALSLEQWLDVGGSICRAGMLDRSSSNTHSYGEMASEILRRRHIIAQMRRVPG
jgi:hypothetical protein